MYVWLKTAVGALMVANFSVPLYTVLANRHLWDEPMVVLAGNMSLSCFLSGLAVILIGVYDLLGLKVSTLCKVLQYLGFGFGIAFKVGQICMAVDQFVAIVHPLRHFFIMIRARPWLLTGIWFVCGVQVLFGLVVNIFDLDTFADSVLDANGTMFPECRWESSLADVFVIAYEIQVTVFSLSTASLLIYTGLVGVRVKRRVRKSQQRQRGIEDIGNETFFDNFRAFKRIAIVLSLTILVDIVGPLIRFVSRWYPMPKVNGFLHQVRLLALIFEGWAYGLLNAKLRTAYRRTLCSHCSSRPAAPSVSVFMPGPSKLRPAAPSVSVVMPGPSKLRPAVESIGDVVSADMCSA